MTYINRATFEVDRIAHIISKTGYCVVYAYGTVEVTLRGETRRVPATRWQDNDILCGKALLHRFQPGAEPAKLVITSTPGGREVYNCYAPASVTWA